MSTTDFTTGNSTSHISEEYEALFEANSKGLHESPGLNYGAFAENVANQLINEPKFSWSPHIGGWYYVNMVPGTWKDDFLNDNSDISKYTELSNGGKDLMRTIQTQMGHLIKEIDPTKLGIDYETISGRTRNIHVPTKLMSSGDFSITYKENWNLDIFRYHEAWYNYIQAYRKGYIKTKTKPADDDFFIDIPYLNAVWIAIFKPRTFKLAGLVKIMGVSPLELPLKDIIGERSNHQLTTFSLSYKAVDTITKFYGDTTPSGNLYDEFMVDQQSFFEVDRTIVNETEEKEDVNTATTLSEVKENLETETTSEGTVSTSTEDSSGNFDTVTQISNPEDVYNDLLKGPTEGQKGYEQLISKAAQDMEGLSPEAKQAVYDDLATKIATIGLNQEELDEAADLVEILVKHSGKDTNTVTTSNPADTTATENALKNAQVPEDSSIEAKPTASNDAVEKIENNKIDNEQISSLIDNGYTGASDIDVRKLGSSYDMSQIKFGKYNGANGADIVGFEPIIEFGEQYNNDYDVKVFEESTTYESSVPTDVPSLFSGKVIYQKNNIVMIENDNGSKSFYSSMSNPSVTVGDRVQQGDSLGIEERFKVSFNNGGYVDVSTVSEAIDQDGNIYPRNEG